MLRDPVRELLRALGVNQAGRRGAAVEARPCPCAGPASSATALRSPRRNAPGRGGGDPTMTFFSRVHESSSSSWSRSAASRRRGRRTCGASGRARPGPRASRTEGTDQIRAATSEAVARSAAAVVDVVDEPHADAVLAASATCRRQCLGFVTRLRSYTASSRVCWARSRNEATAARSGSPPGRRRRAFGVRSEGGGGGGVLPGACRPHLRLVRALRAW